jgi:RimJ/RimL family protein N-acetyltransferase
MLQELYYGLSMDDRILRFFTPQKIFPHKQTQLKVNIDYETTMALAGLVGKEPEKKIICVGFYFLDRSTNTAEISFTVDKNYRGKGLTSYMISRLIRIAQEKGIRGFNGEVLSQNQPMLHILQNLPYKLQIVTNSGDITFSFYFENFKKSEQ